MLRVDRRVNLFSMDTIITKKQIITILKGRQIGRTMSALAREIGVSPQHLWNVYREKKPPGPKVCRYLGIEKEEKYLMVRHG